MFTDVSFPKHIKTKATDLAIFMPSFGSGGTERMMVNLAGAIVEKGFSIDFLIRHLGGPFLQTLPPAVRIVELRTSDADRVVRPLCRYLKEARPQVLLSVKGFGKEAVVARRIAGTKTRLVMRIGTTHSRRVAGRNPIKRWLTYHRMRRYYPLADLLIAVSGGVASDISTITGLSAWRIRVLKNPVVAPAIFSLSAGPVEHPWFESNRVPIILGAGGFRRQKDFSTLIQAFALVHKSRRVRLVILGEGRQRCRLEKLVNRLGLREDVWLPGFVANPYAYMAKANVFVLSSRWEGSPNVLTEALAVGTPVVSTDCMSGPREILQDGRIGSLVPVGDAAAMARAIERSLTAPTSPEALRSAVRLYGIDCSAGQYIRAMGLNGNG